MTVLLLAMLVWQAPLDEASLVVRTDTGVIAHEEFRLTAVRGASPGWTLASTSRYQQPPVVLAPILDVTSDTLPSNLEFDVADPRDPQRIRGTLSRGRFTVRFLGRRTEKAREFPGTGRIAVLDDSVFALYLFVAWQAGPQPVEIAGHRAARRPARDADRSRPRSSSTTLINGASVQLRHVTVTGGANQVVDVWLDDRAQLHKVEIPSRRVRAERLPPA